ncbi:MAG: hypothetical protein KC588_15920 [Nitrospira sp.]|nr:hypothetical protein [Nitrospira sp.]
MPKGGPQVPFCTGTSVTERHFLWRGLCGTEGIKTPGKGLRATTPGTIHKQDFKKTGPFARCAGPHLPLI